ncbi:MAG: type II toxin-antitoxin system ParD family antitoxin [Cyclobacteriaceae bacterium]
MNVSLNAHFENFVTQQLEGGRYNNASEVVRAGLRLLEEQELKVKELREEFDKGYIGKPVPFDAKEIKSMGRELKAQRS